MADVMSQGERRHLLDAMLVLGDYRSRADDFDQAEMIHDDLSELLDDDFRRQTPDEREKLARAEDRHWAALGLLTANPDERERLARGAGGILSEDGGLRFEIGDHAATEAISDLAAEIAMPLARSEQS